MITDVRNLPHNLSLAAIAGLVAVLILEIVLRTRRTHLMRGPPARNLIRFPHAGTCRARHVLYHRENPDVITGPINNSGWRDVDRTIGLHTDRRVASRANRCPVVFILRFSPDVVVACVLPASDSEELRSETAPDRLRPFFACNKKTAGLGLRDREFQAKVFVDLPKRNIAFLSILAERTLIIQSR